MAKKHVDDKTCGRSASTAFKKIDDLLNSPGGGCSTALDRMEQSSWILFLRYLDAREEDRRMEAELRGDAYVPILPPELSWSAWAWPTTADGSFDRDGSLKGDELVDFVKTKLLPGLKGLRDTCRRTEAVLCSFAGKAVCGVVSWPTIVRCTPNCTTTRTLTDTSQFIQRCNQT